MPRIDPLQLINCLQVLLSPTGGILSNQEVHRLVSLMTKFSKKLVSKCVYVLILKNTENTLLDSFMNAGGWTLIQLWLHDGMYSMNWALVQELLELLIITPVDVERLKSNNIPKLVKSLSKREDLQGIQELSSQLVQQWLKIVKGETTVEQKHVQVMIPVTSPDQEQSEVPLLVQQELESVAVEENDDQINTQTFYKLTLKDGKHLISKVGNDANYGDVEEMELVEMEPKQEEVKEKKRSDRNKHKSSSRSSSSSSRDKEKSSSSHRSKDKHSSNSSSSNKDKSRSKDKDKERREKDKHKNNGALKSSSSSSSNKHSRDKKENKEKQAEKDKDTLAKLQPQSLLKLPKIPKKSSEEKEKAVENKEEQKKGTISIEVRKTNEERPKTVKVYKSKMRSTGLEEEAKPAPPRPIKKPTAIIPPPIVTPPAVAVKRTSPMRELAVPPEKKTKMDLATERPGAIKLIPPKPKPAVLQESDMFMDALTASATNKKEPKKRKRRASVSKDSSGTSPPSSPSSNNNSATATSPQGIKNITPPKFYQDTLETDETKDKEQEDGKENADANRIEDTRCSTPIQAEEEPKNNGLKGVLVYVRRKGPKKSIKWKPDVDLVEIQYFELDETERVNVTKTFGDMAKQDVRGEREALQMSRKLPNEDTMDVHIPWRIPMEILIPEPLALPGCKSLEKDIQFAREKSVLQALYFSKTMLPDSPAEPDPENYQIQDPITIPVDDADNSGSHDFRETPWPEPKEAPPPVAVPNNVIPVYPNNPQGGFQNFQNNVVPPAAYPNMQPPHFNPPFMPPNPMAMGEWNNVNIPNMHNPPMMPPNMGPPDLINQQGMNPPNMYMQPPDNFNPMMNNDNGHRFPPPFNQHQPPGMFPPNNFNPNRGGFAGGFRRGGGGGNGPWLRMNGPSPGGWNNRGGGGHRGVRHCNNIRNKGFCRNRDNCPFYHPNT